jgi:hypothetical protein
MQCLIFLYSFPCTVHTMPIARIAASRQPLIVHVSIKRLDIRDSVLSKTVEHHCATGCMLQVLATYVRVHLSSGKFVEIIPESKFSSCLSKQHIVTVFQS